MVTVLPESVAVVAGRKSEYFTSGLAQPLKKTLKLKNKMVAKYLIRVVGLTSLGRSGEAKQSLSPPGCALS